MEVAVAVDAREPGTRHVLRRAVREGDAQRAGWLRGVDCRVGGGQVEPGVAPAVLAPQALLDRGPGVAVRVEHGNDPDLRAVEEVREGILVVVLDQVLGDQIGDLDGDPLAAVDAAGEQDLGMGRVGRAEDQDEDLATEIGRDVPEGRVQPLDGSLGAQLLQVLCQAVSLVPGPFALVLPQGPADAVLLIAEKARVRLLVVGRDFECPANWPGREVRRQPRGDLVLRVGLLGDHRRATRVVVDVVGVLPLTGGGSGWIGRGAGRNGHGFSP